MKVIPLPSRPRPAPPPAPSGAVPVPILWKASDLAAKRERATRRLAAGIAASLLLHVLLFLVLKPLVTPGPPAASAGPLSVTLAPPAVPAPAPVADPPPADLPAPAPTAVPRRRTVPAPPVWATPGPRPEAVLPPPDPVRQAPEDAPSMMAMVEAARARRQREADALARLNAAEAAGAQGDPSANSLNRNLQSLSRSKDGTSGVFQILEKGHRTAQFAFRGWTGDARSGWKEVIEVDAGPQGNIELAIVRKMIELIRRHYQGNFNWNSYRLGRVVPLSARLEDNAGLEEFLMREFFG